MSWIYQLWALLKHKLYFIIEPVKFISWYDLPKDSFHRVRILNGVEVFVNNKNVYTYQDKDVLKLKQCDFFVNNSYAITKKNEWITGTGYAESLLYRITQRKLSSHSKLILEAENATCIGDYPYDNYSHLILDTLPRIFSLYHTDLLQINKPQVFIPNTFSAEYKNLLSYLLPDYCEARFIDASLNARVKAQTYYHLPHFTEHSKGYLPVEVQQFIKKKLAEYYSLQQSTGKKRIYISRQNAGKRKFDEEQPILTLLKKYGFETVHLELSSLKQQLELFAQAEVVIGIHGAGLTNLLWSSQCSVIEIFPSAKHNAWQYEYLAASCGHTYAKIEFDEPNLNSIIHVTPNNLNQLELLIKTCVE